MAEPVRTGVLASFWYYQRFDFSLLHPDCPLILDSGAFSAFTSGGEVNLADYAAWANGLGDRWDFAFNLDVLGDASASLTNWRTLREHGVNTVPVIHFGDHPDKVLPAYFADGDVPRVGLGGLAVSGASTQVQAWCAHVHRWLRDHQPGTKTHGLGIHTRSRLSAIPWTTTDSSAYGAAWRYGRLMLWLPDKRRWVVVDLDGRQLFRYGSTLRRYYDTDPADVAESVPRTYTDVVRFVTRVEVRAANDFAEMTGRPIQRFVTTTHAPALVWSSQEAQSCLNV